MPREQKLLPLLAVFFCALLSFLENAQAAPEEASLREFAAQIQHRQAYGVYLHGKKFGWAIDEFRLDNRDGKEVGVHLFEIQGSFTSSGEKAEFEGWTETVYDLDNGEVLHAVDRSREDGTEVVRTAVRAGNGMTVTTRLREEENRRTIPVPKENLSHIRQLNRWLKKTARRGDKFETYTSSWDQETVDTKEIFTFRSKKTILWGGVRTDIYRVSLNMEGMVMDCDILADGTPLNGMMGGLFELRAEKEAAAKQPGSEPIDLLQASSIPIDKHLGNPEEIESLVISIKGVQDFDFPVSHRQRILSKNRRQITLEIRKDSWTARPSRLNDDEKEKYLRSTPTLLSEHELVRKQAREIVGAETNVVRQAELLQRWTFSYVRQTTASNASTSVDVLKNRSGDCTEITLLYVALARSIGIPAREVSGIMYAEDGEPQFGWHAWAEIHNGRQWITIDPTWNQFFVDATHIKFATGANDWSWVNLLGRLKLNVIKVTKQR